MGNGHLHHVPLPLWGCSDIIPKVTSASHIEGTQPSHIALDLTTSETFAALMNEAKKGGQKPSSGIKALVLRAHTPLCFSFR